MESFAPNAKTRDAIVAARGDVALYFWRGIASIFKRSA